MKKMQQQNQAQMEKMQKEYEDRISAMESKMQSLESKSESGSILNTHVLTDADGKQYEGKGPALDESFLKSLTRNFSFSAYIRAGVQFNGSGGGGNFNFEPPDNAGAERPRLGNENDLHGVDLEAISHAGRQPGCDGRFHGFHSVDSLRPEPRHVYHRTDRWS
jgi:hypothetical protein